MNDPILMIDGFNVLHAVVLIGRDRANWWQPAAQRRLVERVEQMRPLPYQEVWIVFDRRPTTNDTPEDVTSTDPRIRVQYAPSADDWIAGEVERLAPHHAITVVTSDRPLRERVRRVGGTVLSPRRFVELRAADRGPQTGD